MNLILLSSADIVAGSSVVELAGRRHRHVAEVLKPSVGDVLTVGLEGGMIGEGRVTAIDARMLRMEVSFLKASPKKLPVVLCCALMRPLVFKRVLVTAASMGVEEIVFFHSCQVEKSFWQSTALRDEDVREQLILGLEQAKDTLLPKVSFQKKFKPFVEDVLPGLLKGRQGVLADPSGELLSCAGKNEAASPIVLIVGPEGGFVPYEIEQFKEAGCRVVSLGARVLKVEAAIVTLLAKLVS